MTNHQNIYPKFSDHSLLIYRMTTKMDKLPSHFFMTRKMDNFDQDQYREDIFNHPLYMESLYCGDTEQVATNIIKIIQGALDNQ